MDDEQDKNEVKLAQKKWGETWVQTEKSAHELWSDLTRRSPVAAQVLHVLLAHMQRHNRVTASQKVLAEATGRSERGVRRALKLLIDERWIAPYRLGGSGTVLSYSVNDRVAWQGRREDRFRHSAFSSVVMVSSSEQPEGITDEDAPPLRSIPDMYPGERQMPVGPGLPPISQPSFEGWEPDLPSRQLDPDEEGEQ